MDLPLLLATLVDPWIERCHAAEPDSAIVESFTRGYGSLNPSEILADLRRNNELSGEDVRSIETWLESAKARVTNLTDNIDEIVEGLAESIGI